MEKEYLIEFKVIGSNDNTLQGLFNKKTVVKEVEHLLKSKYGDRLKWFVINLNENGLEEIYDSRNIL
jgi:hypothetical protein